MFISHKSNVIQQVHESEWQCRRKTKGLDKPEYWAWLETITSGDPPVVDYSGETDYSIEECTDEDVGARLIQLNDYISIDGVYDIEYYASKRDAEELKHGEELKDEEGNSLDPKQYRIVGEISYDPKQFVQSHFVPQDDTRDARLLADEWTQIRAERTRLLAETDWMMLSDTGTVSTAWKNYRKALREIPQSQDSVKKYADIDWPDKPSS